eukprot:CAMPEP_0176405812 /NCGR_PEP_ID=MMETSP0127-20121128/543_1 /TAXON_ID=938130 /ORGANISM="Platyophrya macrostoma, Strain WH" /LENGTH=43 /DNA_ID= /DNA_START= /DNA_END= /DNA_ORIENTATION=
MTPKAEAHAGGTAERRPSQQPSKGSALDEDLLGVSFDCAAVDA